MITRDTARVAYVVILSAALVAGANYYLGLGWFGTYAGEFFGVALLANVSAAVAWSEHFEKPGGQ